ncbi:tetratricopeptide repeat protein [Desulfohalovibrio reitneri]|uniref:tetratricopeptide repeat protein n=1 Tax=Desulfohalovibrio reitneri TaxID=1307759 RepID=UPI0004A70A88|nr:tetratricopeptide repeat protein [Desulfohalovibrio reitneri]
MADTPLSDGQQDKIRGVFSAQKVIKIGTGTTSRKTVQQSYFYVEEQDNGEIHVQNLNDEHVPTGPTETIDKDELLEKYAPEPEFYQKEVFPKLRDLRKTLARADRHRKRGETFSAEMEYGNALKVDEDNVRANFGIGLCYMERGDTAKAQDILDRVVKLDAAFEEQHKHMFNEFGINLRKSKMFEQAVDYYTRAAEFSPKDENLFYNTGRAYFEMGEYGKAKQSFEKALEINPELQEAAKFLNHMAKKNLI